MDDIRDLADDELISRLWHRGTPTEVALALVVQREDPDAWEAILSRLEE